MIEQSRNPIFKGRVLVDDRFIGIRYQTFIVVRLVGVFPEKWGDSDSLAIYNFQFFVQAKFRIMTASLPPQGCLTFYCCGTLKMNS